jgi:hypothetical protein
MVANHSIDRKTLLVLPSQDQGPGQAWKISWSYRPMSASRAFTSITISYFLSRIKRIASKIRCSPIAVCAPGRNRRAAQMHIEKFT